PDANLGPAVGHSHVPVLVVDPVDHLCSALLARLLLRRIPPADRRDVLVALPTDEVNSGDVHQRRSILSSPCPGVWSMASHRDAGGDLDRDVTDAAGGLHRHAPSGCAGDGPLGHRFVPLARWASAEAAAVFDLALVRPSRKTEEAARAALALVRRCANGPWLLPGVPSSPQRLCRPGAVVPEVFSAAAVPGGPAGFGEVVFDALDAGPTAAAISASSHSAASRRTIEASSGSKNSRWRSNSMV